jgi:hypothetical protein
MPPRQGTASPSPVVPADPAKNVEHDSADPGPVAASGRAPVDVDDGLAVPNTRPAIHSSTDDAENRNEAQVRISASKMKARAAARLNSARQLLLEGRKEQAQKWLREIVEDMPDTDVAREAEELLKK